jgi:hypothetical protein
MRTPARMLAAAILAALVVLPAGVAQARVADERGQQALERTLAREHHAAPAPTNRAQAAESALARTLAREHQAYPAPTGQQAATIQPITPHPLLVVGVVGMTVLLAAAAAWLWRRGRARPWEAT